MEIRSIYNTLDKVVLDRRFATQNHNKRSDVNDFVIVLNLLLNSTAWKPIFIYITQR